MLICILYICFEHIVRDKYYVGCKFWRPFTYVTEVCMEIYTYVIICFDDGLFWLKALN